MFGRMGKKFFKKDFKNKLNEKIRFSINKNLLAHEHVKLGGKYWTKLKKVINNWLLIFIFIFFIKKYFLANNLN